MDPQVLLVDKDQLVPLELKEQVVHLVLMVQQVQQELKEQQDQEVHKVLLALKVQQEHRVTIKKYH